MIHKKLFVVFVIALLAISMPAFADMADAEEETQCSNEKCIPHFWQQSASVPHLWYCAAQEGQGVDCIWPIATRSQGFWSTHYQAASEIWLQIPAEERVICTMDMGNGPDQDDIGEMEGSFWSKISKKTNNEHRTALDQAKMRMAQQLTAAMLNKEAFGKPDEGLIDRAKLAFAGTNINKINRLKNELLVYNWEGVLFPFPPGFDPGPAQPIQAENAANKAFWDVLCP